MAEVWRAFTTSEGIMARAAPFADIDLRACGVWESSYSADARKGDRGNIRNRILAVLPEKMIALQAEAAPPDFPPPEVLRDLFSVVEFEGWEGGGTRVSDFGVGYRETPEHQAVRAMFR